MAPPKPSRGTRVIIAPSSDFYRLPFQGVVGTVTEFIDDTIRVTFDHGIIADFPSTYDVCEDLLITDTGPVAGFCHKDKQCSSCTEEIFGFLWQCAHKADRCKEFHLCTPCYMANDLAFIDDHLVHGFQRIDVPDSRGVYVPPRHDSAKIPTMGTFIGATVLRGPSWMWSDQDGNKCGKVKAIKGWSQTDSADGVSRARCCVEVVWEDPMKAPTVYNYRRGHRGKVDVVCAPLMVARGHDVYLGQFPFFGPFVSAVVRPMTYVKVVPDFDEVQRSRGWSQAYTKCFNELGYIRAVTPEGSLIVQFHSRRVGCFFRLHPNALREALPEEVPRVMRGGASSVRLGDKLTVVRADSVVLRTALSEPTLENGVEISREVDRVTELVGGTAVYVRLIHVDTNEVTVEKVLRGAPDDGEVIFTLPLTCFTMVRTQTQAAAPKQQVVAPVAVPAATQVQSGSTRQRVVRSAVADRLAGLSIVGDGRPVQSRGRQAAVRQVLVGPTCYQAATRADVQRLDEISDFIRSLTSIASTQDMNAFQRLLGTLTPAQLNRMTHETLLHLAVGCPDVRVLETLLCSTGIDASRPDSEGNTPLHKACKEGNFEAVEKLVVKGANVNALNAQRHTPVHLAVGCICSHTGWELSARMVTSLLGTPSSVRFDLQDRDEGNTMLHTAALLENELAVEKILERVRGLTELQRRRVLRMGNKEESTVLQIAMEKMNRRMTMDVVACDPTVLNEPFKNGLFPVHLAVQSGEGSMVALLLQTGSNFNVQARTLHGITPLQLAIKERSVDCFRTLFKWAQLDVELPDLKGARAVHYAARLIAINQIEEACNNIMTVRSLVEIQTFEKMRAVTKSPTFAFFGKLCIGDTATGIPGADLDVRGDGPSARDIVLVQLNEELRRLFTRAVTQLERLSGASSRLFQPAAQPAHVLPLGMECTICMDRVKNRAVQPCGHTFCAECVEAVRCSAVPNCPTCREPILDAFQVFL